MAIIRKKFGNRVYLYEVICKRINGKPRIVSQRYLGKPDDVLGLPKKEAKASSARVYDFGALTALLDIAKELKLIEVIDAVVKKRRQGLTVGEYMLLAAINRAVAPRSKQQFWNWYRQTVLWRLFGYKRRSLTSQRFWDNMGLLTRKKIEEIEIRLNEILIKHFGINLSCLIYDTTNFYTFINTLTGCRLPQRGRNKQRRGDLRQVGLALMVTRDFHIPLFHRVYEGNRVDATQFPLVIQDLVKRYKVLAKGCEEITLVFDKGNNSKDNQVAFDKCPYHFVGSVVLTHHRDLLKITKRRYRIVDGEEFPGLLAYRAEKDVFAKKRTVVITFNPKFYAAQLRGILMVLKKKERLLDELQRRRKASVKDIEEAVKSIVNGQYIKEIIRWEIKEGKKEVLFRWWIDKRALARIKRERLGKKILFTDNSAWSTVAIVAAYHGQYKIEHAFRQMKNPYFVSWRPMFHWTDQKIMIHGFYCVMSLMLVSLLTKRVNETGIKMSCERLLMTLSKIKEVEIMYPEGKVGIRSEYILTELSAEENKLYTLLGLKKYTVKR